MLYSIKMVFKKFYIYLGSYFSGEIIKMQKSWVKNISLQPGNLIYGGVFFVRNQNYGTYCCYWFVLSDFYQQIYQQGDLTLPVLLKLNHLQKSNRNKTQFHPNYFI